MRRETVGRPMEILLVEDSLTSARLTMGALRNGGLEHRLTWLTDGAEAADFLHRRGKFTRAPQPDLVLLDVMLPGKNGRELLADMRAADSLRDIPVVIMTGTVEPAEADAFQSLQVQGFLTKPVDLANFLQLVERLKDYWKADMILPLGQ
ncbi:MAG: response regulator [Planctomycetaceae bacterium]|nr:response regulator [Planctomycetaceae bacterium]